ncbi:tyrosine-type recombinase/integrase [Ornithinimicrobium avium]|uniref:tyrosine-type recombinase/integrase n=1 Tax=Ornithinimicrobium avium TaxID=2283195 RepID=UPI0013B3980A|nr:tyrosine-type recombinase/integrase [Ornithinimicrobium avium]
MRRGRRRLRPPNPYAAIPFATWEQLTETVPAIADVMVRYVEQVACILRPGSVVGTDLDLRSFATYLLRCHPQVRTVAAIGRAQIEGYKPWLLARPGQNKPHLTPATIAHRLGVLRMFFVRIDEWGWPEAPPRVPMFHGDIPVQDHALPKALDDTSASALLRAAQADKRQLIGLTVEVLLRTGLRVGEYTALRSDAVVLIAETYWLHVPVGKLHEDRYLPLHPHLVELIGAYRAAHVTHGHELLIPYENGRQLDRHAVTRFINKAGTAAGLAHINPHRLRHTLATQAINRGMSLEAIAAMLGHKSLDMTLVYARIATAPSPRSTSRSPPRSTPSTPRPRNFPPRTSGRTWPASTASTTASWATATAPGPRSWTASTRASASPARSSRPPSSSVPPFSPSAPTPAPRARPGARRSTTSSSPASTPPRPLDNDHPHNADVRMLAEAPSNRPDTPKNGRPHMTKPASSNAAGRAP